MLFVDAGNEASKFHPFSDKYSGDVGDFWMHILAKVRACWVARGGSFLPFMAIPVAPCLFLPLLLTGGLGSDENCGGIDDLLWNWFKAWGWLWGVSQGLEPAAIFVGIWFTVADDGCIMICWPGCRACVLITETFCCVLPAWWWYAEGGCCWLDICDSGCPKICMLPSSNWWGIWDSGCPIIGRTS